MGKVSKINPARRKAFERGIAAETFVRKMLEEREFILLATRYKTKHGEIDLIMQKDRLIVFVEVKARKSIEEGLFAIPYRAQRRMSDCASLWIAENQKMFNTETDFRFDVAVVTPDDEITLIEGAFDTVE